jgi:MYXO-CTERM domain-containing protein
MMDGDKLVERTVPLQHQQSLIESVDVGFLDPGTATIQKRTKFSFKVTRAHDYAAGEYKVTISDARSGRKVGPPQKIIFKGENEIIDRRSITFGGEKKKKKKDDEEKAEGEEGASEGGGEDDMADESTEEMDLQNEDEDDWEDEDDGEIKEKPGGCGCRLGPAPSAPFAPLALLAGLALFGLRRRS